ncbi:MAG TPA: hypothetical protein PL045_04220 [Chitinophagaceae bacterium]|nr:hypothetical protein [Chitinophagaceae bacterium]
MQTQNIQKAYRSFPEFFDHPSHYRQLTSDEFAIIKKHKMQKADGTCLGHKATTIYFIEDNQKYLVEIETDKEKYYVETPCTFKPDYSIGIDMVDGNLAEDAEAWILNQQLGQKSERLEAIFGDKDKIYFNDYLKMVGLLHEGQQRVTGQVDNKEKKWWRFW